MSFLPYTPKKVDFLCFPGASPILTCFRRFAIVMPDKCSRLTSPSITPWTPPMWPRQGRYFAWSRPLVSRKVRSTSAFIQLYRVIYSVPTCFSSCRMGLSWNSSNVFVVVAFRNRLVGSCNQAGVCVRFVTWVRLVLAPMEQPYRLDELRQKTPLGEIFCACLSVRADASLSARVV